MPKEGPRKKAVWEGGPVGKAIELVPKINEIMRRKSFSAVWAFRSYLEGAEGGNEYFRSPRSLSEVLGINPEIGAQIRKIEAFVFPDKVGDSIPGFTNNPVANEHLFELIQEEMGKGRIKDPTLALEAIITREVADQRIEDTEKTKKKKEANPTVEFREASHFKIFQRALANLLGLSIEDVQREFLQGGLLLFCAYDPDNFLGEIKQRRKSESQKEREWLEQRSERRKGVGI